MLPSVLLLDDEQEVLNALQRVLRADYQVHAFTDAQAAISFFQNSPTQIVISDMKMPKINGAEFLSHIVKINSRCKRVVLTGYADTELAKQAINEGKISAYLNKPWSNTELKETLATLINELRVENKKLSVIKSLKLDNQRLSANQDSMIKVSNFIQANNVNILDKHKKLATLNNELLQLSANLVAMQTQDTSGHTYRVAQQSKMLANRMELEEPHRVHIYLAALFYRIGISSLSPSLIALPWYKMSSQEKSTWMKYPQVSADILNTVESLAPCAKIVRHIYEHFDGSGIPQHLSNDDIPITSRILAIVIHFDLLVSGKMTEQCITPQEAIIIMKKSSGSLFDRQIFSQFVAMLTTPLATERLEIAKSIGELQPDMLLAQDILNHDQHKLLNEKTVLSQSHIDNLAKHQEHTKNVIVAYILHGSRKENASQQKDGTAN
jgi:response regulator RpfG family c-di-GMP phosphodiesterase